LTPFSISFILAGKIHGYPLQHDQCYNQWILKASYQHSSVAGTTKDVRTKIRREYRLVKFKYQLFMEHPEGDRFDTER